MKGNQPALHAAVTTAFGWAIAADFAGVEHDMHEQAEAGHGRLEVRYVTVLYDPEGLPAEWPDVAAVVLVGGERDAVGRHTDSAHYYVTSLRGGRPSWRT